MVFVPGTQDECPFIGEHKFGVEICADHAIGRLRRRSPTGLAFHIMASDYVDNNIIKDKEKGYLGEHKFGTSSFCFWILPLPEALKKQASA